MSGRRLILLAGLAAGLILCMGCQGRPNAGATPTPPAAPKISGTCPTSRGCTRSGGHEPGSEKPAAVQPAEPALSDFARDVYHNGRRSRFATPGGSKRGRGQPRLDVTGAVDS